MQLEDRLRDRDEEYSRLQASSAARDRVSHVALASKSCGERSVILISCVSF
jgi:hypothetical protein